MIKRYLDLVAGDKLQIGGIELEVWSSYEDGSARVNITGSTHHRTLKPETETRLSPYASLYNFGNGGLGDRIHIRLMMAGQLRYVKGRLE